MTRGALKGSSILQCILQLIYKLMHFLSTQERGLLLLDGMRRQREPGERIPLVSMRHVMFHDFERRLHGSGT